MASFDLEAYAPVQERIAEFWRDFPNGSIRTRIVVREGPEVCFECRIFRTAEDVNGNVYTSGYAREVEGKSPVNRTSHIENCETSAIGRALANLGYATDATRASRSEMLKVARMQREHEDMLGFIREVGARCPEDVVVSIGGVEKNLKGFVRENWQAMKEQYRLARTVVDAIESATGETVKVTP